MSLIGLLTATKKQVHLSRLHMRPIQWHLKSNWRIPESLEKRIPLPRSLHPHLQWWLKEDNVLTGQPLHPMQHALQIFTDSSKEGWGPLCALLWRILTWCTGKQVTLKARHIPGRLNVVADKLSRLGQTIQTEWSLHPEVFQTLCSRWHRPQISLPRDSTTSCPCSYHQFRIPWPL